MPALISINLNFDNGTSQNIQVGPQATSIKTPFGLVDLTGSQSKAPTGTEVADNPGVWDGTSFDPTLYPCPMFWNGEIASIYRTWADWFKADRENALDYLANKGILGKPLNLNKLGYSQKKRMGLD